MRERDDSRFPRSPRLQQRLYLPKQPRRCKPQQQQHLHPQQHHQQLQQQQQITQRQQRRWHSGYWPVSHSTLYRRLLVLAFLWLMVHIAETVGPPYPEPEFLPRLLNVTARIGGTAKLPCAVHFLGAREVAWRRLGQNHFIFVGTFPFVKDPKFQLDFVALTPEVTEWNLVVSKLKPSDSGDYECQVTSTEKLYRLIRLNVVGPPIQETQYSQETVLSGKRYVDQGQPMTLTCNVSDPNYRNLRIDWFKDGSVIRRPQFPHVYIVNYEVEESRVLVSELRIDRTRKNDTGLYICRSSADHIDNLKVTILSANTPKEKRGNPDEEAGAFTGSASSVKPPCLVTYLTLTLITMMISTSVLSMTSYQLITLSSVTHIGFSIHASHLKSSVLSFLEELNPNTTFSSSSTSVIFFATSLRNVLFSLATSIISSIVMPLSTSLSSSASETLEIIRKLPLYFQDALHALRLKLKEYIALIILSSGGNWSERIKF